jgi:cytochrome c
MSRVRSTIALSISVAALAALAGCSKPQQSASTAPAPDTSAAPAAAPAPAATPAPAPTTEAAATPAAPAAGMIPLQIKNAAGAPVSGDPASGKAVFVQCQTCHSKDPGVNKVGPSLHGIIGRHSGMIPGFNYSAANKGSGLVWTEQELYTYLENPQKTVPGTYMTYTGVKDPQKRADVIAYLQENTK